jgi:TonB-linked SusC/RagA family outer membrane protein
MQFIDCCISPPERRGVLTKTWMVMKLTAIFIFVGCLEVSAGTNAQTVTISLRNTPLEQVFKEVKKQTGYSFVYTSELIRQTANVTIDMKNASLQQVLDHVLAGQPLTYSIQDKFIIIKPRAIPPLPKLIDTVRPGENAGKIKLQGRITEVTGEPLGGATITLRQGDHAATVSGTTDANGGFRIMNVANGTYILEVTFIGHEKMMRQVALSDKPQVIYLTMKESTNTLDAIQMTAYSKTTMRFNTGDITTIQSEEIARNPVPNVLQSLQGRVPGMFVIEQSGKPNSSFQVQVRSLNTLSGGAASSPSLIAQGGQPLYIIDGVEYPANTTLPMASFSGFPQAEIYGNALNYVDPSLIESINVLKGADATAIYGSRGAFGVILITTKKAKAGKPSLTINAAQGFSTLGVTPKLLNLQQYLALRHNAFANDGTKPSAFDYDVNGTWDTTRGTDWTKFFLGSHAPTTRANATYMGGNTNSNFLLGATYSSIGNIERAKGSVRQGGMNFSLNTATNDRKFTMVLSGSYSTSLDNTVPVDFSGNGGSGGTTQAPDFPYPYLPNGKLNWLGGINPAAALNGLYSNNTDNLIANTTLVYTPVTGLSFTAAGGYSLLSAREFVGQPSSYFNPATFTAAETNSLINQYRTRVLSADPRAEFIHTWGKARLNVIAGGSVRDQVNQQTAITGSGYGTDELLLNPATASSANTGTKYVSTPSRYAGEFAVINFRWADKYILNLNGRRDGSSVFGPNHQFGNFGSVAGAWIISEERWFKGLRNVVDFLKLKASYGLVGGSAIAPYSYINTYGVANNYYEGNLALLPQNLANPYLHWETNRNFEAGLNFDLFKGRVNMEATYYSDKVGDQLTSQPLASITGFTAFTVNSPAEIRSYGAEFMLITKNIQGKDFTWTSKINATIPRTKLLAYPGLGNLVSNFNYIIGKPITGIKLYKYAGVDPATGVYNFYNAAGVKGEYEPFFSPTQLNPITDRNQFVDRAPKWYGGILNSFTYKNFSLDFLVSVTKRIGPNFEAFQTFAPGAYNANIPVDIFNKRWMKPGDITTVPKATAGFAGLLDQFTFISSTGAYSDATYARLQNLSLGYRLPAAVVRRMHLATLGFYVAGQNLLTVSKYKGLDPENMLSNHMPPLRVFTGGINVGF